MEFAIVDLTLEGDAAETQRREPSTVTAQGALHTLGNVDTAAVAAGLEALRADLAAHVVSPDSGSGLRLEQVSVKLTVTAEGKVAFVAKGSLEACIEITFKHV